MNNYRWLFEATASFFLTWQFSQTHNQGRKTKTDAQTKELYHSWASKVQSRFKLTEKTIKISHHLKAGIKKLHLETSSRKCKNFRLCCRITKVTLNRTFEVGCNPRQSIPHIFWMHHRVCLVLSIVFCLFLTCLENLPWMSHGTDSIAHTVH